MSPINQRRWDNFRSNKRGYYALWIFIALFSISICAEFIANDKPLLVSYKSKLYSPVLVDYSERFFGGEFDNLADYKDTYVQNLIKKEGQGWLLWPAIRFSYESINYELQQPAPSPPSSQNWLGTDDQARDVAARLIYGVRSSITFAFLLTLGSSIIGIFMGAIQGFYGGKIDLLSQRLMEIWAGLPLLFILIIMSSLVEPNFWLLLAIMLIFSWPQLVDLVRAEFLRSRNLGYVRAAQTLGLKDRHIILRHILPNAMVASLTFIPFIFSGALVTLTALDFLGFGLPLGSASLGELVAQGKNNLHAPWLGITAFVILALLLSLLIFIGEAVRDTFDPYRGG